jgi:cellulose synthase/poly-beta-1,6-N-acetylglucosamine synthase-like glycosyltransferase
MPEKVSVVATVKDEADSIGGFLAALLSQSRPPDEIVISDGGSTDGTAEAIRHAEANGGTRLRLVEAPGTNIAQGRNRAIAASAGSIVAVTDAGTTPQPDWLERLVRPLEGDPSIAVSGGFFEPGGSTFLQRCIAVVITPQLPEVNANTFLPSSRSVAFRRDWWERAGGYPEWLDHCEDVIFDLELKRAGAEMAYAPDARVVWSPARTLRGFARQYYRYARGDAVAGLWPQRHALRYGVYLTLLFLGGRVRRQPANLGLIIAIGRPYLTRYYRRVDRMPPGRSPGDALRARLLTPLIVAVGDVAKMVGYAAGHLSRLRQPKPRQGGTERAG